jgi:hypothetical protein
MNRRQFLKATTILTTATVGAMLIPAVVRAVHRSTARQISLDDPRALLVDHETFAQICELELRQAIRLQYYVSALVLRMDTDGAKLSKRLSALRPIAEGLRDHIRGTDVLSVKPTDPSVHVLLVGASLDSLPSIIGRIAAAVNVQGARVGGACFPTNARDRAELFHTAESLAIDLGGAEVSRSLRRSATRRGRSPSES